MRPDLLVRASARSRTLPLPGAGTGSPLTRGILVINGLHSAEPADGAVRNLIRFVGEWQPDRVVALTPQARWCSRTSASCRNFAACLTALRYVYDGSIIAQTNALPEMGAEELAWSAGCADALRDNDVIHHKGIYPIAPGWYSLCANEGFKSDYAGSLAINLARTLRASVVCGGTNELASIGQTRGTAESGRPLWGVEIGTVYTGRSHRGAAAATFGFAVIEPEGTDTVPMIVSVARNGSFTVGGIVYP